MIYAAVSPSHHHNVNINAPASVTVSPFVCPRLYLVLAPHTCTWFGAVTLMVLA